jgi:hypothetical protein
MFSSANTALNFANTVSTSTLYSSALNPLSQGFGIGQQAYPQAAPDPPPRKLEVPVLNEGTHEGVMLRARDGKLHWVSVEKIAISIGLEW